MLTFIIIVFLAVVAAFYINSSHQNQSGWNDTAQRNNVLKLQLIIYEYMLRFRRLPRTNQDLLRALPRNCDLMYLNPYGGELLAYRDGPHNMNRDRAGDILFQYCPADERHEEMITIFGFDGRGSCAFETAMQFPAQGTNTD